MFAPRRRVGFHAQWCKGCSDAGCSANFLWLYGDRAHSVSVADETTAR
jgi:hypothetical protein